MARWVAIAVVLCAAGAARADGRLDYERRDDRCPDRAALIGMIEARLGYDPFTPDRDISVRVTLDARRARIEIVTGDRLAGARTVRAPASGCDELARAAALAVAIAIDPGLAFRPPEPEPEPEPVAAPSRLPAAVAGLREPPVSTPARTERPVSAPVPTDLYVGAGVVAAVGAGPQPTPGATLRFGVRRGRASIDVEGRFDRASELDFGPGRVHASLRFASLVPCVHRGSLAACGLVAAGVLHGGSAELENPRDVDSAYLGAGARLGYERAIADRVAMRLHADVLAAAARTTLTVDEMDAWTQPPWSAALGIAAVGYFP